MGFLGGLVFDLDLPGADWGVVGGFLELGDGYVLCLELVDVVLEGVLYECVPSCVPLCGWGYLGFMGLLFGDLCLSVWGYFEVGCLS